MKKRIILIILSIAIILTSITGLTYALWYYKKSLDTNNLLASGCFSLEFMEENNNINLQNTIPLTNNQGMNLTPYSFKLKNTCSSTSSYEINLETLAKTTLDSSFVRLSFNGEDSKLLTDLDQMQTTIIDTATDGRIIGTGVLKPGQTKTFSLRVWLDGDTTATSGASGKSFASKVTVSGTPNSNYITVNLDPNGGILSKTSVEEEINGKYAALPIPTKDGYYFNYWYLDNEENKVNASTTVKRSNSQTLKASWLTKEEVTLLKENAFGELSDFKKTVTEIKPYREELTESIINNATIISDNTSLNKAYAWLDGTTLYYAGETSNIYMQNDLFGTNSYYSDGTVYINVTSIDLSCINTSLVTSTRNMFRHCRSLTEIDLTNFYTSNVTSMSGMFFYCYSLTDLDLSSFDTSSVTDMSYMFATGESNNNNGGEPIKGKSKILSLDLSHFDTSKVTDMSSMFYCCCELKNLDISNFDTSKVTNMNGMFSRCESIEYLNLYNFDTTEVANMRAMFYDCKNIKILDLFNFDTSNVTSLNGMFAYNSNLNILYISSFDTSNVTDMKEMFESTHCIKFLNITNFDTSNVTDMSYMFCDCNALENIDLSNFKTANVDNMEAMFSACSSLKTLDLSHFDTSKVTNMKEMFNGFNLLTTLDLSSFDTSNVTDMRSMFSYCESLVSIDLSSFNTGNVTEMSFMFNNCKSLLSLDLINFNTSNCKNFEYMFYGCESLISLNLTSFNTKKASSFPNMFNYCKSLVSLDLSSFTSLSAYPTLGLEGCSKLEYVIVNCSDSNTIRDHNRLIYPNITFICA